MKRGFWDNKNVLITGYEGFLGSSITQRLISLGANIVGLDIKVGRKQTILTRNDYKRIVVTKGDVTQYRLVENIISRYRIGVVFHLAAQAIVTKSVSNPLRTFSSNIQGTWNVLEACRNCNDVEAIVCASSDKAYGSHKKLPYRENLPLKGSHPYDVSKSCADLLAHTYSCTYNLPVAITRCGNIYGPGDFNFSRIIPDIIVSLVLNKTLLVRSDGKFTRDYIYVDDIVDGYILLAENLQKQKLGGESINFSGENPIAVLDLVKKISKLDNKKLNYKILNQAKYEIKHQYLCSAKARRILDWRPKYSLAEGLLKTLGWYRARIKKK